MWHVQLPAGGGSSSQQYLLPTAATHNLHAPACYSPAAAAGFLAAGMTDMSAAAAPIVSSHINNNAVSEVIILPVANENLAIANRSRVSAHTIR